MNLLAGRWRKWRRPLTTSAHSIAVSAQSLGRRRNLGTCSEHRERTARSSTQKVMLLRHPGVRL
jgi:hypothetical protein